MPILNSNSKSLDVEFKDLGLLIIDEEQRFGVEHKEKINAIRKYVKSLKTIEDMAEEYIDHLKNKISETSDEIEIAEVYTDDPGYSLLLSFS